MREPSFAKFKTITGDDTFHVAVGVENEDDGVSPPVDMLEWRPNRTADVGIERTSIVTRYIPRRVDLHRNRVEQVEEGFIRHFGERFERTPRTA